MKHRKFNPHIVDWDYTKTEKWLNEMSAKGLQLVKVGPLRYVFEDSEPNKYTYKMELMKIFRWSERKSYVSFLKDFGIERIPSSSPARIMYLRKKSDNEDFVILPNAETNIEHYKRINKYLGTASFLSLPMVIMSFIILLWELSSSMTLYFVLYSFFAILLFSGFFSLRRKIKKLEEEKQIFDD